jgi:hypothetical protein
MRNIHLMRPMNVDQTDQLRDLYAELQEIATAAVEALGPAGSAPRGMILERFRDLNARVYELVEQIINTQC